MKELAVWEFALKSLQENQKVALLVVLRSEGSSPGRQGFKMALTGKDQMTGSIGGGIMEHKLVELARNLIRENQKKPVLKRQIHSKNASQNQSGMICSGEQTIAIYLLTEKHIPVIESLLTALHKKETGILSFTHEGLAYEINKEQNQRFRFTSLNDTVWEFTEKIPARKAVYIVGGGHVSLALSKVLRMLDFDLHLFDDRANLNTFSENPFVHFKTTIAYPKIAQYIPEGPDIFVVIMTIGYRTDKEVLKHLLGKEFGYLGMLGSKAKVEHLFSELQAEGFSENDLKNIHAPIGIQIKSQTPEEIAISIAAEIIQVKNA